MSAEKLPQNFQKLQENHPDYMSAVRELGKAVRDAGPLDEKTVNLVQLGAAAAQRLEGAVHSHARRAMAAGATTDELRHALIVLTSTIGFPAVAAAMSWITDLKDE
ncbi:alkylhydroperoxidase AhpD family core domain-containing protein [Desulfonatronum thiosulfatophilum]|uniref:Alkylhydroperoxidase AhpD family core domain-containing protein n=1 Tax=Desulfonatronum thiosulfatophilum TaxID=617002 RepID=A0A1G6B7J5_9BACT|nr:carboxymuconolactone decarboxylase family protein [Desulfonatronum thiosulfatophilum]SDB16566.1 alkylhydroperoxidase AhpD family core domain-containing protein [Desulfonatronum thiosulfatophilum]